MNFASGRTACSKSARIFSLSSVATRAAATAAMCSGHAVRQLSIAFSKGSSAAGSSLCVPHHSCTATSNASAHEENAPSGRGM